MGQVSIQMFVSIVIIFSKFLYSWNHSCGQVSSLFYSLLVPCNSQYSHRILKTLDWLVTPQKSDSRLKQNIHAPKLLPNSVKSMITPNTGRLMTWPTRGFTTVAPCGQYQKGQSATFTMVYIIIIHILHIWNWSLNVTHMNIAQCRGICFINHRQGRQAMVGLLTLPLYSVQHLRAVLKQHIFRTVTLHGLLTLISSVQLFIGWTGGLRLWVFNNWIITTVMRLTLAFALCFITFMHTGKWVTLLL